MTATRRLTVALFSARGQIDFWWSVDGYRSADKHYEYQGSSGSGYVSHSDVTHVLGFGFWHPTQYRYRWVSVPHAAAAVAAIQDLPEAYRETLAMRLVDGLSGPEIAEATGLTPDSVRVNLHRGFKLLRERLGATP